MTQINYKAEVKRVYPDAYCRHYDYDGYCVLTDPESLGLIGTGKTARYSWKSAYENLKKQGKL